MKNNAFLDSNILIYLYSNEIERKDRVIFLLKKKKNFIISRQVIHEFCNVLIKKFNCSTDLIVAALKDFSSNFKIIELNNEITVTALQLFSKLPFSFYDCIIISPALYSECEILYSEDFQSGLLIENKLRIINPFLIDMPV